MRQRLRAVAYYRVSTQRQGRSGLSLDAQRAAVETYVKSVGGTVIESFIEVESGRNPDRSELVKALSLSKAIGGTLVVAKLDRLGRNVAFLSSLIQAGTEFVACDNPHANKLTLHILASVAEYESELMSSRIKAALNQARARGRVFGCGHDPRCSGRGFHLRTPTELAIVLSKAATTNRRLAREFRDAVKPVAKAFQGSGMTNAEIASKMNAKGYSTRKGKPWTLATVSLLINAKE